jgi:SAM-dependent methyltransferase
MMSVWAWAMGSLVLLVGGCAILPKWFERNLRSARDDHSRRPALWERFYSVDWGATTTNNYGFAPARGDHPERFQHQMYRELFERLKAKRPLEGRLKVLEVSCGRGGGLMAFVGEGSEGFDVTGLDVAPSAVAFCRRTHGETDNRRFVEGSALALPFADATFDVLLNVEASNDYGDREQFFREVARVRMASSCMRTAFVARTWRECIASFPKLVSRPSSTTSPAMCSKPAGLILRGAGRSCVAMPRLRGGSCSGGSSAIMRV